MLAETLFMQPQGHFTTQPTLPFRGMEMAGAVQGVARKGRRTLAGDDEDMAAAVLTLSGEEMQELDACGFQAFTMEIKSGFRFDLAPVETLGRAAVQLGEGWWRI